MNDFDAVSEQIENQEEHVVELPLFDFGSESKYDIDSWGKGEFEALGAVGSGANNAGFIPRRVSIVPDLIINTGNAHTDGASDPTYTGAGSFSAFNNYLAKTFTAHENYSVNRVAFRCNVVTTPQPGYTITGGITSYDSSTGFPTQSGSTLVFLGSGTAGTFVASTFTIITLGSTVSLTAGTKYTVAIQCTNFVVGGSINPSRTITTGLVSGNSFPTITQRTVGAQGKVPGGSSVPMAWGYNNGIYTQWYGCPFQSTNNTTYLVNRTSGGFFEVGSLIRLDWNIQEIFIRAITISRCRVALGHTLVLKIYEPDGITQVQNASSSISSDQTGAETNIFRPRTFTFPQIVRLLPYTNYYVMLSATGTATNTNSSGLLYFNLFSHEAHNAFDLTCIGCTRDASGGAISISTSGIRPPMTLTIDDTYVGNRTGIIA